MLRLGLILTVLLSAQVTATRSMVISSVSRLDLSSGRIMGEHAGYYLEVPTMWSGYMIADRERVANGMNPLEKITFYYKPVNNTVKPLPIVSFNIYSKYHYNLEPGYRKLFESEKYIFTAWGAGKTELTNPTDAAIYSVLIKGVADDQNLAGLFRLEGDGRKLYNNTIWVNGRQLNTKAIVDGNVTYLPIRDVCETLGYKVGWVSESNAVTLARADNFYEVLLYNNIDANNGYHIRVENDKSFISSLYFLSDLNLDVEIDERFNVLINE
jgi:hypothetical protein